MYTIKKTRKEGNNIVFNDTYTLLNIENSHDAQQEFLKIVSKEIEWLFLKNIKTNIELFKNDILKNEIKIHLKNS